MKYLFPVLALLVLNGCEMTEPQKQSAPPTQVNATTQQIDYVALLQAAQQNQVVQRNSNDRVFVPYQHHKTLVNYVEQMALELADTMQQDSELGIAITTFVDLDASLNTSSQLGNQIAESMMYQLQKFGHNVVDFKAMDVINVTARGDFVMTREVEELAERRIASHVLAGTLIYRTNGVEVNARIINLDTKRVTASAQNLIPSFVLENQSIALNTAP